jgi:pimeloyl-ACP methyl ester carboxylesterase
MKIVDRGSGTPIVLVPGIQGRWEWMAPAVDALSVRNRVITFSLADEPTAAARFDPAEGFSNYVRQIGEAMDLAAVDKAIVCGVSYGGLIAAMFAKQHPERVEKLVLVSALPPAWTADERVRFYLRAPRLLSPLFFIGSVRLYKEIAAASPGLAHGLITSLRHGSNALRHMLSPSRMARRVRMLAATASAHGFGDVHLPTLVITGEPDLERVMPVFRTLEYVRIWPHAQHVTLQRTGHLGLITRPREFADIVAAFADEPRRGRQQRRRIG